MSTDNSSNSGGSDSSGNEKESPSFTMPDLTTTRDQLKQGIHTGVKTCVQGCNAALGSLQHTTEAISRPVNTGMEHLEMTAEMITTETRVAWERRHEFGPYYVGGVTLGVFGITALRRGRWPGLMLGGLAGAATYVTLYEPLLDSPTFRLPEVPTMDQVKAKLPSSLQDMLPASGSSKKD